MNRIANVGKRLGKRQQPIVKQTALHSSPINHPPHYGGEDDPYEAIKVIDAWRLGFSLGNTVKYISRAGKKGGAAKGPKSISAKGAFNTDRFPSSQTNTQRLQYK